MESAALMQIGFLFFILVVGCLLPSLVAKMRDSLSTRGQPVRKPRNPVGLALVLAVLAFVIALIVIMAPLVAADFFKVQEARAATRFVGVLFVAAFITGMIYRAVRWIRVDAPRDGEGGQATAAADSAHSPNENTGQTSTGRGTETGPVKS